MQSTTLNREENIYTVSRLTSEVRTLLETNFFSTWVEGEVSNFSAPNSGHWYFGLKDANAQVRCAMFRGSRRKLTFIPKDGMHVLVKAKVSLYENRGDFQLIVEDMEERGEGQLRRAFEALKKKLETAGIFDAKHKQTLPKFPQRLGIITSATGAAIRDVLTVLKRRHPALPIIIYPTLVQGREAAQTIVKAIELANQHNICDVLLVTRGGGSLEDLWPFNEEIVALAIHQSKLPIISAIGHEVDFTIADFVADLRAPTPSAAAEIVSPDKAELIQHLARQHQLLWRQLTQFFSRHNERINWIEKQLSQLHPKKSLLNKMQFLDNCELNLLQAQNNLLRQLQKEVHAAHNALQRSTPAQLIQAMLTKVAILEQKGIRIILDQITDKKLRLANAAAKLDGLSPLGTLQRGYAIAMQGNNVLMTADEVSVGETVLVRLGKGALDCQVQKVLK